MAFSHGSKAKISVDNAAGTLTDISSYVSSIGMPQSLDTASVDVMGSTSKQSVTGLSEGTVTLDGKFDPTLDALMDGIKYGLTAGGMITIRYDPQGNSATGLPRYTMEAWLTSYEVSTDVGDAASWTATFSVTGAITRSTTP